MRVALALAVLMLWPITAVAKPAPLPPGVTASSAKPVRGLYIHATDDRGGWGATEIWLYRAGDRAVEFSTLRRKPGEASGQVVGITLARREVPSEFQPQEPACNPRPSDRGDDPSCFTGTVEGVAVHCRSFSDGVSFGTSECVSIDEGRTRGMMLDSKFNIDDGSQFHHFDVDRIDQSAAIDPAVFEAAAKEDGQ
jgi:hypothetical protein